MTLTGRARRGSKAHLRRMFGSDGYHPRSALLVTSETPGLSMSGSPAAVTLAPLLGKHGAARELRGPPPRFSTGPRCPTAAVFAGPELALVLDALGLQQTSSVRLRRLST